MAIVSIWSIMILGYIFFRAVEFLITKGIESLRKKEEKKWF